MDNIYLGSDGDVPKEQLTSLLERLLTLARDSKIHGICVAVVSHDLQDTTYHAICGDIWLAPLAEHTREAAIDLATLVTSRYRAN